MSQQHYEPEFKKKLVRLHLEEGRTLQSLSAEYGVAKSSITIWCRKFSKECREQALTNPTAQNELELMKENRRLRARTNWESAGFSDALIYIQTLITTT